MSTPLLTVENLSLGFRGDGGFAHVLDGANLTMRRGEIMGLVGESGCGKTTLASAILGVLPRHSLEVRGGRIDFDGVDMLSATAAPRQEAVRGRRVTFIPQDPFTALNPVFTIGQQIDELMKWKSPLRPDVPGRLPALLTRYPKDRRRQDREKILATLAAVQLPQPEQMLRKYPHEVSGGQRQRLMIAMALLPEPDLIIADEPTTALDVTIQAQILGLLRRLATERGVAVMLTTHDLGSAYEICDRITVMYAGQEVESAPVDEFFNAPSHPYTAKLLASRPEGGGGMTGIPGELPSFYAPPPGCRFAPRCDRAQATCASRPPVAQAGPAHIVRCVDPLSCAHPPVGQIKESLA
ncbi:peptide/nickel transport system ATP-binding protein [Gemmobacter megaterium]|uniref:Peptide/nickel transport system ATP-binding protein n=1 Tax=Gemmobacter megaterium TaxID=1086013 RepID=A0A1N7QQ59_9RHOB|nr:ABC transporter ATP-binding protein [Gemmobacter megaterium]GGE28755.1 ABC transporter ATP-binding protein [Gemmobacter megaterium]SIT25045.1 peptide/nickel transport system ATP-binding protein [Gemmobacter megaterium]